MDKIEIYKGVEIRAFDDQVPTHFIGDGSSDEFSARSRSGTFF